MTKTFKTVCGLHFIDYADERHESFQLVCEQDGLAYASIDLLDGKQKRFFFADSIEARAKNWCQKITSHLESFRKDLGL